MPSKKSRWMHFASVTHLIRRKRHSISVLFLPFLACLWSCTLLALSTFIFCAWVYLHLTRITAGSRDHDTMPAYARNNC
ncbi:unnamed protein product [Periconia digitata]|uniref:Uncharacterized protein n=1 Tax=Periconia digitata TaxID=1303443 RepID=A0A9W4XWC0_9PLEO|nr:unnamed protein product [Periconia digitata]